MRGPTPVHLALLLSAVASASPAAAADPAAPLDGRAAACLATKARVLAELAASHQACTHDFECVPFWQDVLGCDGWRDVRQMPPPLELWRTLAQACTGVPSAGVDCKGQVGACVAGKCRSRPRAGADPEELACRKATKVLKDRASIPVTCTQHHECSLAILGDDAYAVGLDFALTAARERHAFEDACPGPEVFVADDAAGAVTCKSGVCRLSNGGRVSPLEKPRLVNPNCVLSALVARPDLKNLPPTDAVVRFFVSKDGKAGAFTFAPGTPRMLEGPIADAVLSCAVEPGKAAGARIAVQASLAIRLRP